MSREIQSLFIYGTLAPGRANHQQLSDLKGSWEPATCRGRLLQQGWGAAMGYPGIVLDDQADAVAGFVFSSDELSGHWERLDQFEGDNYTRVKALVTLADGRTLEAFVYALKQETIDED